LALLLSIARWPVCLNIFGFRPSLLLQVLRDQCWIKVRATAGFRFITCEEHASAAAVRLFANATLSVTLLHGCTVRLFARQAFRRVPALPFLVCFFCAVRNGTRRWSGRRRWIRGAAVSISSSLCVGSTLRRTISRHELSADLLVRTTVLDVWFLCRYGVGGFWNVLYHPLSSLL